MRIGIPNLPGCLGDDAARAVRIAGATPVLLWHQKPDLQGVDAVIVPGGATYGNYLRPGALAALTPVMRSVARAAREGLPVLGLGSGFAALCEAGLLPGALVGNSSLRFVAGPCDFTVENSSTPWTSAFTHAVSTAALRLPVNTGAGQYTADEQVLDELESAGRVVLRYAGSNATGSARGIAGVANEAGNVVGVLAAPQNAIEAGFGPSVDGLGFFTSIVDSVENSAQVNP